MVPVKTQDASLKSFLLYRVEPTEKIRCGQMRKTFSVPFSMYCIIPNTACHSFILAELTLTRKRFQLIILLFQYLICAENKVRDIECMDFSDIGKKHSWNTQQNHKPHKSETRNRTAVLNGRSGQ